MSHSPQPTWAADNEEAPAVERPVESSVAVQVCDNEFASLSEAHDSPLIPREAPKKHLSNTRECCHTCSLWCLHTFCSFKTALAPLLLIAALLSAYILIVRLALKCYWSWWLFEPLAFTEMVAASTFLFGVLFGVLGREGWMYSGWIISSLFCVFSSSVSTWYVTKTIRVFSILFA